MSLMIRILQFGFATGAVTRFDCLRAFVRAYPDQECAAISAAAEFERGCCYCPEQEFELAKMTDEQFAQWLLEDIPRHPALFAEPKQTEPEPS